MAWFLLPPPAGGEEPPTRRLVVIGSLVDRSPRQDELVGQIERLTRGLSRRLAIPDDRVHVWVGDEEQAGRLGESGIDAAVADRDRLTVAPESWRRTDQVWLFLMGYASTDFGDYRFHLGGPDWDGAAIGGWVDSLHTTRTVIWLLTPGSGAMVRPLSGPDRVIFAATESAQQINGVRLTEPLSALIDGGDPIPDRDGDGRSTAMDWFIAAADENLQRHASLDLMLSEHALVEDSGDGRGEPVHLSHIDIPDIGETDPQPVDIRVPPRTTEDGALAAELIFGVPDRRGSGP